MSTDPVGAPPEKRRLRTHEYVVAGIPLLLMFVGGAVGGAAGGCAFVVNVKIFQGPMAPVKKYALSTLVTIAAYAAYVLAAGLLALAFPGLLRK
jgi:hypothetical protein